MASETPDLTGKQRRHLRALGHALDPVVQIGHQGLTEPVANAVDEALEAHELIKVKVGKNAPDTDRAAVGAEVAAAVGAALVQTVGRVIVLYRPAKEKKARRIELPRS